MATQTEKTQYLQPRVWVNRYFFSLDRPDRPEVFTTCVYLYFSRFFRFPNSWFTPDQECPTISLSTNVKNWIETRFDGCTEVQKTEELKKQPKKHSELKKSNFPKYFLFRGVKLIFEGQFYREKQTPDAGANQGGSIEK